MANLFIFSVFTNCEYFTKILGTIAVGLAANGFLSRFNFLQATWHGKVGRRNLLCFRAFRSQYFAVFVFIWNTSHPIFASALLGEIKRYAAVGRCFVRCKQDFFDFGSDFAEGQIFNKRLPSLLSEMRGWPSSIRSLREETISEKSPVSTKVDNLSVKKDLSSVR